MKQTSVLNVLMHIFQTASFARESIKDDKALFNNLVEAGFDAREINSTMTWLKLLQTPQDEDTLSPVAPSKHGLRIFTAQESRAIDCECQDYIYSLEREKVIDSTLREHIIDLLLKLHHELDITAVRWVCFIAICADEPDENTLMKFDLLSLDTSPTGAQ